MKFTGDVRFILVTGQSLKWCGQHLLLIVLGFTCLVSYAADSSNSYNTWEDSSVYDVSYIVDLSGLPADEAVTLWVPRPVHNEDQHVLSSAITELANGVTQSMLISQDIVDNRGNRVIQFSMPAGKGRADTLHFEYQVRRLVVVSNSEKALGPFDDPSAYLGAATKIPLEGLISQIALQEKGDATTGMELQRRYYDYVYDSMAYSKEGEGWGEGDAIWACESKYGNCTDFHSLYIGLVRSQGIAARFKIGFPLAADKSEGRHDGYHCWAEVYDPNNGWSPLDASEAKKSGKRDEYFGRLPSDRIEFTQGRDLVLSSLQRGEPINYFIYPYAESETQIMPRLPVKLLYKRIGIGG